MALHPLAGQLPPADLLIDVARLEREYYERQPENSDPNQRVHFGTSGHRGTPSQGTFTQAHILAITQAICDYRRQQGWDGPLFLGRDTHALSAAAQRTALEVLAANGVITLLAAHDEYTPTPVISHALLTYNRGRSQGLADGIVLTPSHNPPADGGIKYNPPHGGPAETVVTAWIQERANALLAEGNRQVRRLPYEQARRAATTQEHDYITPYVRDLAQVVDLEVVRRAGIRLGVDPLGGASLAYWQRIQEEYRLELTVVNSQIDPTFRFLRVDHDGQLRMDCSSPYALAGLLTLRERFTVAWGNDPDADRHGIVSPSMGLMNPNHYLAVALDYLLHHRPEWPATAAVGKTLVSSSLLDRVAAGAGRSLFETPVGFKWFVTGLYQGTLCFAGEESAGATFLRRDGRVWTTDKDGLILGLLAAEITARTGQEPGEHYRRLTERYGTPYYCRQDAPATPAQKAALLRLSAESVTATELAGEPIRACLTHAPGNGAPLGGLKVVADSGWFAARPSGTENLYKIYAESFRSPQHLEQILAQARQIVAQALAA
jgi:phosphoglucomutase